LGATKCCTTNGQEKSKKILGLPKGFVSHIHSRHFNPVIVSGKDVPVVSIVGDQPIINNDYCGLRTIKDRYDPKTKEPTPSVANCISAAESVLTMHYGIRMVDEYFYDDLHGCKGAKPIPR